MKKLLLTALTVVCFLGFYQNLNAQTQRLVLVEEFTNASCGPCASQNPGFNTLLHANPTKVVAIKYQTNWPGTDPMNAQTQTLVGPRVTYYGVTGVPWGAVNGTFIANDCNAYDGAPACLTQAEVNTAYAIPSPFIINLTHTLNNAADSIFISATIKATQSVSGTTLKARIVLVEKEIVFTAAPGSNGEKEFYDVMRTMYPNSTGSALNATWNTGDSVVLTFAEKLPAYIYDKGQLAVVAFVQDDANKDVKQAAYSAPIPLLMDASMEEITNIEFINCNDTIKPKVTLKNKGITTITASTISYKLDNGTAVNYSWTGNLVTGASEIIQLPNVLAANGNHTLTVTIVDVNTIQDQNPANGTKTDKFVVVKTYTAAPITESFALGTFPPAGFFIENPDAGTGWIRSTTSSGSAKCDFYNSPPGQVDILYVKPLSLAAMSSAALSFKYAYTSYSATYIDSLIIEISNDCGTSWTSLFSKGGADLYTAPVVTSAFTPTASQWKFEAISLSSYVGQGNLLVRFKGVSDYGNNLYVDDININNNVSIEETNTITNSILFPNPTSNYANLEFELNSNEIVKVDIINSLGQLVKSNSYESNAGQNTLKLDVNDLKVGFYTVNITINNVVTSKKLSVIR